MRNGYRIIDADRHVIEPFDLWRNYLPPKLRAHAPREGVVVDEPLAERVARLGASGLIPSVPPPTLGGRSLFNNMSEVAWIELSTQFYLGAGLRSAAHDPRTYLDVMDQTGVDIAFLFPSYGLCIEGMTPLEPALASACATAYNEWLEDFCRIDPGRLRGVGLISLHDPPRMVPELERAAGRGWKAVVLRPNPVGGRLLSDPAYEPFWTACEQLSIAVALHEGTHAYIPAAGADRFRTRFALHACSHPMEQMMAMLALIEGGVLERHPNLRFAALEAGVGWLPYWLWRLDNVEYTCARAEVAEHVKRKPSEYFRRQYFAAIEPDEPYLADLIGHIGQDNLLFGTDFPHLDHAMSIVDTMMALEPRLPPGALQKMLWDNPARLYGVDG